MALFKKEDKTIENAVEPVKEIEIEEDGVEEVNLIEALLSTEPTKIKREEKTFKIPSLSKLLGRDAVITIKAIPPIVVDDINKRYVKVDAEDKEIKTDARDLNNHMVMEMCYVGNEQLFRNKALMKHFGCARPTDLIEKLLSQGEIAKLNKAYSDMSGYKDDLEEVKN